MEISFILPTRNRVKWVKRAVDSCLFPDHSSQVFVIDGHSTDGTFDFLSQTYSTEKNVTLLKDNKSGFMNTCFQGVDLVKTPYVAFMYDDDVLSPYFHQLFEKLKQSGEDFILGYGITRDVDDLYQNFNPVTKFDSADKKIVMLAYYDWGKGVKYSGIPVNPICSIVKTEILREWVKEVKRFGSQNDLRNYFMLKKNIGPDLMIFLHSLLSLKKDQVTVANHLVAHFSEHPDSMTIIFPKSDIAIGYWLAKIWGFEKFVELKYPKDMVSYSGIYLIFMGGKLFFQVLLDPKADKKWLKYILSETLTVAFKLLHTPVTSVKSGFYFVFNKLTNKNSRMYLRPSE